MTTGTFVDKFSEISTGDTFHQANYQQWLEYKKCYDGGYPYINKVVQRNPLESEANFVLRRAEAYYFNYPATIIGLYAFAIMEQEPKSDYGQLNNDEVWQKFSKNCDLFGSNLKDFIDRTQIYASVYGAAGVLVNKPPVPEKQTKQYEIDNGLMPYTTMYPPSSILEARFARNYVSHKIELTFLKLQDIDDRIQVWTKDSITVYEKATENPELVQRDMGKIVFNGENPLKEIPFFFMKNLYNPESIRHGLSDLREIEPISASIVRNCSVAEEVIKNAGFPMMRKPMLQEGQADPDETGPTAILEFDPTHGDAGKPDWLKPEVRETVVSVLEMIDKKTDEIYRTAYLSGMNQQAKGTQVRSGVALRYELRQLTSILTQKIKALSELESEVIRFFLMWQNQEDLFKTVSISRPVEFTMDELIDNVALLKESLDYISSDEYNMQAQKRIIQLLIPGLPKVLLEKINNEIYSTRKELLAVKLKDTADEEFGLVHVEAENAQELAKINAKAVSDAAKNNTPTAGGENNDQNKAVKVDS